MDAKGASTPVVKQQEIAEKLTQQKQLTFLNQFVKMIELGKLIYISTVIQEMVSTPNKQTMKIAKFGNDFWAFKAELLF